MSPLLKFPDDKTTSEKQEWKNKLQELKETLKAKKDFAVAEAKKAYKLLDCFVVGKVQMQWDRIVNSLTAKSVPAGTKLVLFGRYVLNIYVGIVRYILRRTKTWRAKIYLPTQRTSRRKSYDIN